MADLAPIFSMRKFQTDIDLEKNNKKKKKTKKLKPDVNELLKNVSIPKGFRIKKY